MVLGGDGSGLAVREAAARFAVVNASAVLRWEEPLATLLIGADLREHALAALPDSGAAQPIWKVIVTRADFEAAIGGCAAVASDSLARSRLIGVSAFVAESTHWQGRAPG